MIAFDPRPHRRDAQPNPSSVHAQLLRAAGAASLLRGRKHGARKKLPRQQRPTVILRGYARAIDGLLLRARPAIDHLLAEIPGIIAHARASRGDADGDEHGAGRRARDLIERVRAQMASSIGPGDIERLAARFAEDAQRFQRVQIARQVRSAFGADVLFRDPRLRVLVNDFTQQNVGLITSIPTRFAADVEALVQSAVTSARAHPALAEDIEQRFAVSRSRAELIARDQVGKFYAGVNHARQRELGVERFVWRTVNDERVRDEHSVLDGETFSYDDPPDEGLPGDPVLCRCSAEPVLSDLLEGDDDAPGDDAAGDDVPAAAPDDEE